MTANVEYIEPRGVDELCDIVTTNVMAEAARRRMTQKQIADALLMSRASVSARYNGHTPWTIDELAQLGRLFGLQPAQLLAAPAGWALSGSNRQPTDYEHAQVVDLAAWRAERVA